MVPRNLLIRYVIYAALGGLSLLFLTPLVWMVSTSFKPDEQAMAFPPEWLPRAYSAPIAGERLEVTKDFVTAELGFLVNSPEHPGEGPVYVTHLAPGQTALKAVPKGSWHVTEKKGPGTRNPRWDFVSEDQLQTSLRFHWESYPLALKRMGGESDTRLEGAAEQPGFSRFLGNTLLVCVLGVIGTVLSNAVVAYGFARLQWRGRDAFFALTLATMMVPFPVLIVPTYGLFKSLGWIGTLLPLWLPNFFGSAFNIFLMRQFFLTIPEEISEAARLDGCREWTIFWRIILPLSKPVLTTAAVFHFLYAWNDFMGPMLYLTRRETFTLALALQSFQSQNGGVQWPQLMAASTVTVIPVIVLFVLAQRAFVRGIATTGSKS